MRSLGLLACVLAVVAVATPLLPKGAYAGAWTQPKGEGQIIATAGRRVAPPGAITGGTLDRDSNVSQLYLEYGLIDGLTVGAKAYVELSTTDLSDGSASLGGFLRKRVWQSEQGSVGSIQAGYAHPIESMFGRSFDLVDPGAVPEIHASALYGRGWGGDWGNAFLSTGAGYFLRGRGTADDLRFELTGGYAPSRQFMGILSVFALAPLGPGTDASLKIAPSIAVTLWPERENEPEEADTSRPDPQTIQLGLSYDALNPNDGLGISLSFWHRF